MSRRSRAEPGSRSVPRASAADTAAALTEVALPLLARGVIIRRPSAVRVADRLEADARAVRRMQRLRRRYGPGPLRLRVPGRSLALVLDPDHVHRILEGSPEPFAVANLEKQGALAHFQPHGVLISHGDEREQRRRVNEEILDYGRPVHHLAEALLGKLREEADALLARVEREGRLTWETFVASWYRMVRRVVLGDRAADDHEVTDLLADLRAAGNWSFLGPRLERRRGAFLGRLATHLDRAEADSLAALVARQPDDDLARPRGQVPQWLFAFDAAAWASFRALALLGSHPEHAHRVRAEIAERDLTTPHELPHLRATVLESLRLWPTTPGILRDSTTLTGWESGTLPAGTGLLIFAPYFHRDEERLSYAHRFAPGVWRGGEDHTAQALVPFSDGPGECPGRDLVLLLTSSMLAQLLERARLRPEPSAALVPGRMPATLSPFHLAFAATPA